MRGVRRRSGVDRRAAGHGPWGGGGALRRRAAPRYLGLDAISIDHEHRSATVGAGCLWGAVDAQAAAVGLLGRAGSSPTVAVAGFTFGAGAGWLSRPGGLASGALTAVEYVGGSGALRRASDAADDPLDRDVIWACRGGGGVGIAVTLQFDLVPFDELWAGYLLWPVDALDDVVSAWTRSLPETGPGLATSLAILRAPPSPLVPEQLHGSQVVHLSMASTTGEADARALRDALGAAPVPAPVTDTWGPADVDTLGQIHLDPPEAVPALGVARWLNSRLPVCAADVLRAAVDGPLALVELRHVANDAPVRPGALDRAPGDFMRGTGRRRAP